MKDIFISRRITIRRDQYLWLRLHPEINLSGLAQKAIDEINMRFVKKE